MQKRILNKEDYLLFAFVRAGLLEEVPYKRMFPINSSTREIDNIISPEHISVMTYKEWDAVYKKSWKLGVKAIAWDGIIFLLNFDNNAGFSNAIKKSLPKDIKLKWAYDTEHIENVYNKHLSVLYSLCEKLAESNIDVCVLKGLALSDYYPKPNHRECGDIDIFCGKNYENVNIFLKEQGCDINIHNEKHSSCRYKKVSIENHQYFLNKHIFKVDKKLDAILVKIYEENSLFWKDSRGFINPNGNFNFLFLTRHMIVHINNGASLRQYTDWMMYLLANKSNINYKEVYSICSSLGIVSMVCGIFMFCVGYLGLNKNTIPEMDIFFSKEVDKKQVGKIMKMLLKSLNMEKPKQKEDNAISNFRYKLKIVICNMKNIRMIHNESRWSVLYNIFLSQIKTPDKIFSIKKSMK